MTSIGHSLIGDKIYGHPPTKSKKHSSIETKIIENCKKFNRQALHSSKLKFKHPISNKRLSFNVSLPCDMKQLINLIK